MAETKTILFAEDDPLLMTLYGRHLTQAGYNVIPAVDGLETMKNLAQSMPDLVVLDLMMPKFDGEDLLHYICNDPRLDKVPLFILSSNSILYEQYRVLLKRADKYLLKHSCTPAILLEAIQRQFSGENMEESANPHGSDDDSIPTMIRAGLRIDSTG